MCQQEAPVLSKYKHHHLRQIDDINQQDLEVKVTGNINTQSERLVEFLKRTPLNNI
jgi:hypothetical protein